jgi:hypothetical protein
MDIHDIILNFITKDGYSYDFIKKLNIKILCKILDKLRYIEYNQSNNTTENIQLTAFIAIFKKYI